MIGGSTTDKYSAMGRNTTLLKYSYKSQIGEMLVNLFLGLSTSHDRFTSNERITDSVNKVCGMNTLENPTLNRKKFMGVIIIFLIWLIGEF